jgi:hypothetical protein
MAESCPKCGHPTSVKSTPETSWAEIMAAYGISLVIPLFGLIAGIWLWNWRKQSGHGAVCIILAFVSASVIFFLLAN